MVQLEEVELKKGKNGGHILLIVNFPKVERGDGFSTVSFEKHGSIKLDDLLSAEEVEEPEEKDELDELRKVVVKKAKTR